MPHILVVGKTPSFLDFTHRFFEGIADLTVDQVPSADDAMGRMAGVHYDTILAEHHPPKTDGIGFLERLQSSGNATALVLYPGSATRADLIRAANHGVAYILQKDGDLSSQKEAIREILRPAGAARAAAPADILSIARIAPVGIFRTDLRRNCTYVNERWCDIAGLTAEEALGNGCIRAIHPEDRDRVSREWDNAAREQRLFRQEYRFRRPDGRVTWVVGQAGAEVDPSGRNTGYIGTITDITDRRTAEERIAHLASFPDLNPNPVLELDPSGKVLYTNPALAKSLSSLGREVDPRVFLPGDFPAILQGLREGKGRVVEREVRAGDRVFLESISFIPRIGTVRIYARDITDRKRAIEALQEEVERFRIAAQSLSDVVYEWDIRNSVQWFGNIDGLLGYAPGEFPRTLDAWRELIHPEDRDRVWSAVERQLRGEAAYDVEYRIRRRDGAWRHWQARGTVLRDPGGRPSRWIGAITDVTGRKRAEEELRQSREEEQFLADIIENAEQPLSIGYPDGRLGICNQAFYDLTGYTAEELRSVDWTTVLTPPEWIESERKSLAQLEQTGRPVRYQKEYLRKDGRRVPIELLVHVVRNGTGRVQYYYAFITDITEWKEAVEALRESEEKYRNNIANLSEGFSSITLEGIILDHNREFTRLCGFDPDDNLVGKNSFDFWQNPDDRNAYLAALVRDGFIRNYPVAGKKRDGEGISLEVFSRLVRDREGKPARIEGVVVDVTERKRAEIEREKMIRDLAQKNTELERFTYTVSHDLKSPLITIVGFLGFLEEEAQKGDIDRLHADIKRIRAATEKMQTLLSDLLNLSRIGRIVNPPVQVPFATIAREAVEQLQSPLQQRGVTVEIAPDLPVVNVDHERLREVVVNLVENAVKFMGEQPTPRIEIGVKSGKEGPVFFVRDNGIGIDPQYHGKIFGLFEKLDAKAEGTGVGLAVVRRIIEVHGGRIWVESAGKNTGSTFRFTLPVVQEEGTVRTTQREG